MKKDNLFLLASIAVAVAAYVIVAWSLFDFSPNRSSALAGEFFGGFSVIFLIGFFMPYSLGHSTNISNIRDKILIKKKARLHVPGII